ncbi:MAG: hypothetical protein KDC82_02645 [Bacteroidetes bacterium]|nr:hypothetical protein [Bacteroidota bacterium]
MSCTTIFQASFDTQTPGPPSNTPPGNPLGDAMNFSNGVTIITPALMTSNSLQIKRTNRVTYTDFVASSHRSTPVYNIFFQGYVPREEDLSPIKITAKGLSGEEAFYMKMVGGKIYLKSGTGEELIGNYVNDQVYTFLFTIIVNSENKEWFSDKFRGKLIFRIWK